MLPCHPHSTVGTGSSPVRSARKLSKSRGLFMSYYFYIIQSLVDATFYKGSSKHPGKRLIQHNEKKCKYTSKKVPWILVYVEEMESKTKALIREKSLKKATTERIKALLIHPKNIVHKFLVG